MVFFCSQIICFLPDSSPQDLQGRIEELSLSQLENLSEALLDFGQMDDLVSWLEAPSEEEVLRPAKHPPALWLIQNSALFLPDTHPPGLHHCAPPPPDELTQPPPG